LWHDARKFQRVQQGDGGGGEAYQAQHWAVSPWFGSLWGWLYAVLTGG
jgi:hypothetical protein